MQLHCLPSEMLFQVLKKTLIFLTDRKVLANGVYCQKCSNWMSIVNRSSVNDKYLWVCNGCRKTVSVRIDSFWFKQTEI